MELTTLHREGLLAGGATAATYILQGMRQRLTSESARLEAQIGRAGQALEGLAASSQRHTVASQVAQRQIAEIAAQKGIGQQAFAPGAAERFPELRPATRSMQDAQKLLAHEGDMAASTRRVMESDRARLSTVQSRTRLARAVPVLAFVGLGLHAWAAASAFQSHRTVAGSAHVLAAAGHTAYIAAAISGRAASAGRIGLAAAGIGAIVGTAASGI